MGPHSDFLHVLEVSTLEALFDQIPDTVFFVKNQRGEYTSVNATLVERCGYRVKADLVGRTTLEAFTPPFGERYHAQDRQVLETRVEIRGRLELHLYREQQPGWCLTHKVPLYAGEKVVGLLGVSKDLHGPDQDDSVYPSLARAIEVLQGRFSEPLRVEELAHIAGLSRARFERHVKRIFGLTPGQLLAKTRLEAATRMLREKAAANIAEVAHNCGYSDHSAFTRHFKSVVGVTPTEFRQLAESP